MQCYHSSMFVRVIMCGGVILFAIMSQSEAYRIANKVRLIYFCASIKVKSGSEG